MIVRATHSTSSEVVCETPTVGSFQTVHVSVTFNGVDFSDTLAAQNFTYYAITVQPPVIASVSPNFTFYSHSETFHVNATSFASVLVHGSDGLKCRFNASIVSASYISDDQVRFQSVSRVGECTNFCLAFSGYIVRVTNSMSLLNLRTHFIEHA